MDDHERQQYEDQLKEKDERIEEVMKALDDALTLLNEIKHMTKGI